MIDRKAKRQASDLTDDERNRIEPPLPTPARRSREPDAETHEAMNETRYMARPGDGWRTPPNGFPSWQAVHRWFRDSMRLILFRAAHAIASMPDRSCAGPGPGPNAGMLASQTARTPATEAVLGEAKAPDRVRASVSLMPATTSSRASLSSIRALPLDFLPE